MMNILFLAPHPFFQDRGTPIAVRLMLQVLSAQGHQIKVLTYPEGEDVKIDNCEIIRLPALPGIKNIKPGPSWKKVAYDFLMFFKVWKLMRQHKFDLIHAVEESAFIAKFLQRKLGIPFVYDMDSSLPNQIVERYEFLNFLLPIFEKFEKSVVLDSIGVIAVCKSIEDSVKKYDPNKLIQRLEDISLLPSEQVKSIDKGQTINIDGPIIMYIGNLEKYQGIDLLLDSFQIVSKNVPDAHLVIIGGAKNDIKYYKDVAMRLGIGEKALFMGQRPVSDLPLYLSQADILISPRIKGYNTPMKIYSYLDSGKVVLATNLPTHTQVLDKEIAYLTEANPQDMAEGLVQLLSDEGLRERLAANAKERVQEEYNFEAFERKVSQYYSKIEKKISKRSEYGLAD